MEHAGWLGESGQNWNTGEAGMGPADGRFVSNTKKKKEQQHQKRGNRQEAIILSMERGDVSGLYLPEI